LPSRSGVSSGLLRCADRHRRLYRRPSGGDRVWQGALAWQCNQIWHPAMCVHRAAQPLLPAQLASHTQRGWGCRRRADWHHHSRAGAATPKRRQIHPRAGKSKRRRRRHSPLLIFGGHRGAARGASLLWLAPVVVLGGAPVVGVRFGVLALALLGAHHQHAAPLPPLAQLGRGAALQRLRRSIRLRHSAARGGCACRLKSRVGGVVEAAAPGLLNWPASKMRR